MPGRKDAFAVLANFKIFVLRIGDDFLFTPGTDLNDVGAVVVEPVVLDFTLAGCLVQGKLRPLQMLRLECNRVDPIHRDVAVTVIGVVVNRNNVLMLT